MRLTREEFDILSALAAGGKMSQGAPKDITARFVRKNYIKNGKITQEGLAALEPYRVRRAIFMAAGFGARMMPITINTPKPLVRVNGKRIIDTLLDACLRAGIEEIYIVRGYLAEQFDQLLKKYPMIKFLENPMYDRANSISSLMKARTLLENAYVLEADLYVSNPDVIKKYQYASNILGIEMDKSDDWCFVLKDGYIDYHGIGGVNCFQEIGISYFTPKDGRQVRKDIRKCFEMQEGKNWFWEYVLFGACRENYKIEVRECGPGDVLEIDTFQELKAIDKKYDI